MANQQKLNVLIVDREEEAQLQLKQLLSEQGYGVTCLSEPLRAPEEIRQNRFQLIVLDVSPGTGGATFDTWSQDELTAEAPSGVQSVRIRLSVWKNEDSGSFDAHFDNVLMVQPIFEDDFESGDTSLWDDEFP